MPTPRTIGPVEGPDYSPVAETAVTNGYAVAFGTTAGNCTAITAAGQRCMGISRYTQTVGKPVRVTRRDDAVAIAGGAITHGQFVKTNAVGKLIAVTGTAGSGEEVIGRAESDAVADGDEFIVFVQPFVL